MSLRILLSIALSLCLVTTGTGVAGEPACTDRFPDGSGGTNAPCQQDKPYLVLVSIDGFRWDYQDHFRTPALDRIAAAGVRAERLVPVWPTLTFPNHYSIATGLYPANHGLVANRFYDRQLGAWYAIHDRASVEDGRFYAGEPIWVTAERHGMVAAAFFFVGTEAPVHGVYPTHWKSFDKDIAGTERVDQVLAWLAEPTATRPHLYTLYFEDVDDHSHWYGPGSEQGAAAIARVDGYLQRLLDGLAELPHGDRVNIVVVSDHGQRSYHPDARPFVLDAHVNLEDLTIVEGGSYAFLYFDQPDQRRAGFIRDTVNAAWNSGRAWLPASAPAAWRIRATGRYPDVILQPDPGHAVISAPDQAGKVIAGDHGWAPEDPAMHGIFLASGPGIESGAQLGAVRSVDIYPLLLGILGLEAPGPVDGDPDALRHLLRRFD